MLRLLFGLASTLLVNSIRVMFVGNSFTFVNDLPGRLTAIAQSLGKTVESNLSAIGGYNLYSQLPEADPTTAALLAEEWDFIVLQDYSMLGTVQNARSIYFAPAVKSFLTYKKKAKVVMYSTWGYVNGSNGTICPETDVPQAFPLGTLDQLTQPSCLPPVNNNDWEESTAGFDCMSYSVSRAYLSARELGADLVAPCGEAWQVVRMSKAVPQSCALLIDKQYASPPPIKLPITDVVHKDTSDIMLYLTTDAGVDKHPSPAGQYLNALVFYSLLFNFSAVGAAIPSDLNISQADAESLQIIASGVVLQHRATWGLA
jgi:hypothetical protein